MMLCAVTWALLSPDPFAVVRSSPLGWLSAVNDGILHLTVFSCLTVCAASLAVRTAGFLPATVVVALVAYAIATELLQGFVPGRTCDPADALANSCGIIFGIVAVHCIHRFVPQPEN